MREILRTKWDFFEKVILSEYTDFTNFLLQTVLTFLDMIGTVGAVSHDLQMSRCLICKTLEDLSSLEG